MVCEKCKSFSLCRSSSLPPPVLASLGRPAGVAVIWPASFSPSATHSTHRCGPILIHLRPRFSVFWKLIEMNQEDRISKLPDAVLCKILSFLELRLAIQSSILSKRWKPLWTFLEDLDFYASRVMCRRSPRAWQNELDSLFVRFVNGVLSNRDHTSKIGKFRLANLVHLDPIFVQNCIHYAVSHNVQELDFDAVFSPKPFRFPPNFFEARSLRKLRLKCHGQCIIPKPFSFPNLKMLSLDRFSFKDGDDFCLSQEPFSGFPNLEKLTLNDCNVDGLLILAPELKVFELIFSRVHPRFVWKPKILKVEMPKLKSFMFYGDVCMVPPMEELPCLDDVNFEGSRWEQDKDEALQIKLIKFLEKLKNAKNLSLSFGIIEVLSMDLDILQQYPSPFVNLRHLKIASKEESSGLLSENVMAYFANASSFKDSIIVEYPIERERALLYA